MDLTTLQAVRAFAGAFWRRVCAAHGQSPKVGVALGGGFARGIAHVGVLRVFESLGIPIHAIAGVSAGSIVAAAYASGATPDEIGHAGCAMRFTDVARWMPGRLGLAGSDRMTGFLCRLLKSTRFQEMTIPLAVVATDLVTGEPAVFRDNGDVCAPIRASCSYPGLLQPVRHQGRLLVDGAMSVELPARILRDLGATYVVSVSLPATAPAAEPRNAFQVINRCFQILQARNEHEWRAASDLVIEPDVRGMAWDSFGCGEALIRAGEMAAESAMERPPMLRASGHSAAFSRSKLASLSPDFPF
jgi:NTE family protein